MKQFNLAKWRAKHGLTQAQASDVLLISHRTVQRIEAGEFPENRLAMVQAFCEKYDKLKATK